ncbi:MAG: ribose-phosphate pyrophosphokinase [Chthonomonadales bacterium]|nr:ribose-phosphate pyrophosphokinase [Chthonomonadales bacterium]
MQALEDYDEGEGPVPSTAAEGPWETGLTPADPAPSVSSAGVNTPIRLFAGSGNEPLAQAVASRLDLTLADMHRRQFADGEIHLRCDETVRGTDAYIIQPTCPPVNDHLVELLIWIDAVRRASAQRVTAVIPYYAYARQEKKDLPREPISAKLIANLLERAGADRIMVMDLHADAIQGFFGLPVDHLTAIHVLARHIAERNPPSTDIVVVSPDEGRVKMARRLASLLGTRLAVVYTGNAGEAGGRRSYLAGEVKDASPVIIEDMVTTGRSVLEACDVLIEHGCRPQIRIAATHGVFAGEALRHIAERTDVAEILVTDTVPQPAAQEQPKLSVVSVADLFSASILRAHYNQSISSLFPPAALSARG